MSAKNGFLKPQERPSENPGTALTQGKHGLEAITVGKIYKIPVMSSHRMPPVAKPVTGVGSVHLREPFPARGPATGEAGAWTAELVSFLHGGANYQKKG